MSSIDEADEACDPDVEALQGEVKRLRAELKRVDRERVEYLQNVSHQLVAPLNAIKWHIENLTSRRIGVDRAKKVLRSIYSQSTLAVHLAKNFTLMSNLEADHALSALKEPLQPVSLCPLLINLADDFQPIGWDKDVEISVRKEGLDAAPDVLVMKPLIGQTFSNLIENAVKYSDPRTTVVIEGSYVPAEDAVTVRIRNRGIPLEGGDANQVFTRGYRSAAARNKHPAGTGFGLYIARKIVEIHQGRISATTTTQGLVEFAVTLSTKALEGKARKREPKDRTAR